jgi:hypothetical protein
VPTLAGSLRLRRTAPARAEPYAEVTVVQRPIPHRARRQEIRVGAVIAVALAIGLVVWLVAIHGGGSSKSKITAIPPTAASPDRLRSLANDVGHPVYWAGAAARTTYELTETSSGRIYVRYLPKGVPVGSTSARYTIVGTYPVDSAYNVLNQLARKRGESSFPAPNGGFAVYADSTPTNIYLAYPGKNVQIEVYDPSPKRAGELITSGRVAPVQ